MSGAADAADRLLHGCPGVRILATSRVGLNIEGETVVRVASLGVPKRNDELTVQDGKLFGAIALFEERASAALENFSLDERNTATVAQICRRLDRYSACDRAGRSPRQGPERATARRTIGRALPDSHRRPAQRFAEAADDARAHRTGAMTCSRKTKRRCSEGSPSSQAGGRSMLPVTSAPIEQIERGGVCSISYPRLSTSRWSSRSSAQSRAAIPPFGIDATVCLGKTG